VPAWRNLPRRSRGLSLRTLVILRWMAIFGQSATIATATLYFHFDLPLWGCLAAIAASVAMNLNATARLKRSDGSLPDGRQTAAHLGFDILQLSILLGLTGGLQNPFCLLLVAPVTVAAASLPGRQAALMGLMVLAATVSLFFIALPLPWQAGTELNLPPLYKFGIGMALVTGVIFTSAYAWRVAADAEKLELALATTQDVLQREQRLAALGGLAAAAAHELGTPLATIQVVAKELLRASAKDGAAAEKKGAGEHKDKKARKEGGGGAGAAGSSGGAGAASSAAPAPAPAPANPATSGRPVIADDDDEDMSLAAMSAAAAAKGGK
jgi:two-component system sensor histidine kinase RegB